MNRKIFVITILFITLISGCAAAPAVKTDTMVSASPTITPIASPVSAPAAAVPTTTATPYEIVSEAYTKGGISIKYPQIKGLGDEKREKAINELIRNDMQKAFLNDPEIKPEDITEDIGFKVGLKTDELLSVVYTGNAYVKGGAHPTDNISAITIDLKNDKKLSLADITPVDSGLLKKMRQSKKVTNDAVKLGAENNPLVSYIAGESDDILLGGLREGWANFGFYLKPDALVLSIGVPHALGDYALVELPGWNQSK